MEISEAVERILARKDAPDRVVILASVVGQFSRNLAAPGAIPHLHVTMPHVEKLADLILLLPPILPLTSLGTIKGRLAYSVELEIRRCFGSADDAAPEHDHCWIRVGVCSAM
jgi:hypothetical protein